MKKLNFILFVSIFLICQFAFAQSSIYSDSAVIDPTVDTRVDNNLYWRKMIEKNLVQIFSNKNRTLNFKYIGSQINSQLVKTTNSVDIMVGQKNFMQSENSVFINPNNFSNIITSMNTGNSVDAGFDKCKSDIVCGTDYNFSLSDGDNWENYNCLNGYEVVPENGGDPTTAINNNGNIYLGYITLPESGNLYLGGQGVSFLINGESNWNSVVISNPPNYYDAMFDKNHLWVDNSFSSQYEGNLYNSWTYFDGVYNVDEDDGEIQIYYSDDGGYTWTLPNNPDDGFISKDINAGSHNQGVNINTGPNGEVYAVWSIYDVWPGDESSYGFTSSFDGGVAWNPSIRIVDNIEGVRVSGVGASMRVNSFPSMAVDISKSLYRGTIYVVYAAKNDIDSEGYGVDIFLTKSDDKGTNWYSPEQITFDQPYILNEQSFFPWISCDPETGLLSIVYYYGNYSSNIIETKVINSYDGGQNWEEVTISDYSFTPISLNGTLGAGNWAPNYFGDYIGIDSHCGFAYPVWTANLVCEGAAESYASPYQLGDEDLFLDGIAENKIYFASNSIAAAYEYGFEVNQETKTSLISGNTINLKPGCHIQKGSVLKAVICNCNYNTSIENSPKEDESVNKLNFKSEQFTNDEDNIRVFPIPTKDKITIEFLNETNVKFKYEIYDIKGQLLKKDYKVDDNKSLIDLSYLPNNIYVIKIITEKGSFLRKILKYNK